MKSLANMSPFMKRVALGKMLGFVFGIAGFLYMVNYTGVSTRFAFGFLLWYMITGTLVGAFGVMNKHPLWPSWKMPWWFRGGLFGGFMMIILALVSYDTIGSMLQNYGSWFVSPYWIAVDGIFFGLIVDYLATSWYGEGKKLLK